MQRRKFHITLIFARGLRTRIGIFMLILMSAVVHSGVAQDKSGSVVDVQAGFGSGIDGVVRDIVHHNGSWFAGGAFATASDQTVNHIARWDGSRWVSLVNGVNAPVSVLYDDGSSLLVGGEFTEIGQNTVNRIARWDGYTWQALGTGVNGTVHSIVRNGNDIYIGGDFTMAGGMPVNHIAKWNGVLWEAVGDGFNEPVLALAIWDGKLVAGGAFTASGGNSIRHIAVWAGTTWQEVSGGTDAAVNALAISGDDLVVGGAFQQPAQSIAVWNGTSWNGLDNGINGTVYDLATEGDRIVAVGDFEAAGSIALQHIAFWDGNSWSNPGGTDTPSSAVDILDDIYFVGGDFNELAGQDAQNFSRAALGNPQIPVLVFPENAAVDVSTSPVVSWQASLAAFSYQVQISEFEGFFTQVLDELILDATSVQARLPVGLKTYYYRVRAFNNLGESAWSPIRSFTTRLMHPDAIAPEQNAADLGTSVAFSWTLVPGAQSYWLQVANTEQMDEEVTLIADESGLSQTTFNLDGLTDGATYYWRVKAERIDSDSDWSDVYRFSVNLLPAPPVLLDPPHQQANTDTSSVTLRWGLVANAGKYRVEVSQQADFEEIAFSRDVITTTETVFTNLKSNISYYWRVRSGNEGGYSSWSVIRQFNTRPAVPSVPVLSVPENNASGIQISPKLEWLASARATGYKLEISTTPSFSSTVVSAQTTQPEYSLKDLLPNRTYYWRVSAVNVSGESNWSAVFAFGTTGESAPAAPVLSAPASGAADVSTPVSFSWNASAGATDYRLQISVDNAFTRILHDETVTTTNTTASLGASRSYFWRVAAINEAGEGAWSAVRTFATVNVIPAVPVLVSPSDLITDLIPPISFRWRSASGAASYEIEVSTDSGFGPADTERLNITDTLAVFSEPLPESTYFWRVRATSPAGSSAWTTARAFVTAPQPPAPVLLHTPGNGLLNVSIPTQFVWRENESATSYRLQVSITENFRSTLVADMTVGGDTAVVVNELRKGVRYFWRVAAVNAGGIGDWSQTAQFVTTPEPPLTPVITGPSTALEYVAQPVVLTWQAQSFTERFQVQLSLDPSFNSQILLDTRDIEEEELDFRNSATLPHNTVHYWRIRAINSAGDSPWSPVSWFRTLPNNPQRTILEYPDQDATGVFLPLALQWRPTEGAHYYEIQVATGEMFISNQVVIHLSDYMDVTYVTEVLNSNESYFWRVRAWNVAGAGEWSVTGEFRTAPQSPEKVVLSLPESGSTQQMRAQLFRWLPQLRAERYEFELSLSAGFESKIVSRNDLTEPEIRVTLPSYGTSYFWRVRGINLTGSGQWSDVAQISTFDYPDNVEVDYTVRFPGANQSDYRLISIPGESNMAVTFPFEGRGRQGTDWNAFAELGGTGANSSTVQEVRGNSPDFTFVAGRGFWVLARRDLQIQRSFPSVTLNAQETYTIPLKPGWNIIANPYHVDVQWSEVTAANGITDPVYRFEGNWRNSPDMVPGVGYYFLNRSGLSALKIAFPGVDAPQKEASEAKRTADAEFSTMELQLQSATGILGSASIVIHPEATAGYDAYDFAAPPSVFTENEFYLLHPESPADVSRFSQLSLPAREEAHHIDLEIRVSESGYYILKRNQLSDESVLAAELRDQRNSRTIHFDEAGTAEIYLVEGKHRFTLVIGSAMAVQQAQTEWLPQHFELYSAYPNPFNPTTNISFSVPQPAQVQLRIIDVAGRLVSTLYQGEATAGIHTLTWDASRLASGIYLVEMTSGKHRFITKVTLIK